MISKKISQNSYDSYWAQVQAVFPDLTLHAAEWIESGYHSLALILNQEWVFRFPLKEIFYDEYRFEQTLLNRIRPAVSITVPAIELFETSNGFFSKHRFLVGEQYRGFSENSTLQMKEVVAAELAHFLSQLHTIKSEDFIPNTAEWATEIISHPNELYPVLNESQRQRFERTVTAFEAEKKQVLLEKIVLCHNDLNENNFLIHDGHLSGIIDFGNATRAPLSTEFAPLMKHDFPFTRILAEQYERLTGERVNLKYAFLVQKLRCYCGMAENKDNLHRLARYNRWLTSLEANEEKWELKK